MTFISAILVSASALPTMPTTGATEFLGSIAAVCTTASLVPQLFRVWTRKSATDISLGMFSFFSVGVLLWLIYGILIRSRPVEAANAATLVLSLAILMLKLRYDRPRQAHANACTNKS
ncbi:MAG: SemiSWEET transporter [Acidobacteriaceae bacterium]